MIPHRLQPVASASFKVFALAVCAFAGWATAAVLTSCHQLPAIKSAFDVGVEACELFYGQHAELRHSMTPQDVCKIAEVVQPFVDGVLAQQGPAGQKSVAALASRPK